MTDQNGGVVVKQPIVLDTVPELDELALKMAREDNRSEALLTAVNTWKEVQEVERGMRKSYATVLIGILIVQSFLLNVLVFMVGAKGITIDEVTLRVFIGGVFGECVGLVWAVVNYLFQNNTKDLFQLIRDR